MNVSLAQMIPFLFRTILVKGGRWSLEVGTTVWLGPEAMLWLINAWSGLVRKTPLWELVNGTHCWIWVCSWAYECDRNQPFSLPQPSVLNMTAVRSSPGERDGVGDWKQLATEEVKETRVLGTRNNCGRLRRKKLVFLLSTQHVSHRLQVMRALYIQLTRSVQQIFENRKWIIHFQLRRTEKADFYNRGRGREDKSLPFSSLWINRHFRQHGKGEF